MSNAIEAIKRIASGYITSITQMMKEVEEILSSYKKEGGMEEMIEKFEAYNEELETLKSDCMGVIDENSLDNIHEELMRIENDILTNDKINEQRKRIIERLKETKEKWEITVDVMMIIGKYFEKGTDYTNIMKISKKWKELVLMYHFNPIGEYSLFKNMESQYIYSENDEKREGMHQYVC